MPDDVRVFVLTGDDRAVRNLVRRVEKLADLKVTGSGVLGAQFDPGQADVLLVQPTDSAQLSASLRSNLPLVLLLANRTLGDVTAEAVLPFDADSTQIRAAILAVAAGLRLQPSAHDRASMDEDELAFLDPLTERELSVLNLLAEGLSNPEIAAPGDFTQHREVPRQLDHLETWRSLQNRSGCRRSEARSNHRVRYEMTKTKSPAFAGLFIEGRGYIEAFNRWTEGSVGMV